MTIGHPDWDYGRRSIGIPVLEGAIVTGAVADLHGPYSVPDWAYIAIYFSTSAIASWTVKLSWFFDQAMTRPAGQRYWRTREDTPITDSIHNLGLWLLVTIINEDGHTGENVNIGVTPRQTPTDMTIANTPGMIVEQVNQTVGAGGSGAWLAAAVMATRAGWYIESTATSWEGWLYYFTDRVTPRPFAHVSSATAGVPAQTQVMLPSTIIEVVVANHDGVARDFSTSVVPFDR